MNGYWDDTPAIKSELNKVVQHMLDAVSGAPPVIRGPVEEIIRAGGKMLRPALVIIGAKFGRYNSKRIIPVAACVELLHAATLIHDDIIDESRLRRGIESVQSKYSKDVAVLIGDYIFAKTFEMLSGDYPPEMLKRLSSGVMNICRGELSQYSFRYSNDMSLRSYLNIISGKTASLFTMSLFAGAYEAKADAKMQKLLVKIGYCMGMMFQIVDDCLDYHGDTDALGKNTINDIKQGYITLPIYFALQNDESGKLRDLVFQSGLSAQDAVRVRDIVTAQGGVDRARQKAEEYFEHAQRYLARIAPGKNRSLLEHIARSLIARTY